MIRIQMYSKENISNSYLLKIFFKQFTILSVLKSLPLNIEGVTDEILTGGLSLSPSEDFDIFSFECVFQKLGVPYSPTYSKLILVTFFFMISLAGYMLAMKKYQKKRTNNILKMRNIILGVIFIFLMDNIVPFLSPFIKKLFYININDDTNPDNRLLFDFSLRHWDHTYKTFFGILCVPLIFFVGIFTPY